ncbi:hypothetical protein ACLIBH_07445 [Virgibacillus sp. W0430]
MKKCIECNAIVEWNERSSLCEECFDNQLRESALEVKVESPHASWF